MTGESHDNGHDNPPIDVMTWLSSLKNGHDNGRMARGKHFYFNCDKGKHYVYEVDESRREIRKDGKTGRKKRVYIGVLEASRGKCPAAAALWESKHVCHDQPAGHDNGHDRANFEQLGTLAGRAVLMARE